MAPGDSINKFYMFYSPEQNYGSTGIVIHFPFSFVFKVLRVRGLTYHKYKYVIQLVKFIIYDM